MKLVLYVKEECLLKLYLHLMRGFRFFIVFPTSTYKFPAKLLSIVCKILPSLTYVDFTDFSFSPLWLLKVALSKKILENFSVAT